ncbi:MAG: hypothetical protein EAZ53_08645 [Bacteroidetes bacterium]|nr:MAG: hypothetical protein EAZ53_08645 [Bacteroidota bacterium]
MVYTDIILMILTLGISFYIALHYEYEIKQEKKWVEFEKKIFEMLESEKIREEQKEAYNQIYLDMKKNREETETWIKNLFKINNLKID